MALDLRLYLRAEIAEIRQALPAGLQSALVELGARHAEAVMPGYTHLQRAQPVLFAHHLLAYVEMFARDDDRLADAARRLDVLPLGQRRAGRLDDHSRPAAGRANARLFQGQREQHGRRQRPGLRLRIPRGRRHHRRCTCRA